LSGFHVSEVPFHGHGQEMAVPQAYAYAMNFLCVYRLLIILKTVSVYNGLEDGPAATGASGDAGIGESTVQTRRR